MLRGREPAGELRGAGRLVGAGRVARTDVILPLAAALLVTAEVLLVHDVPVAGQLAASWFLAAALCWRRSAPIVMPLIVALVSVVKSRFGVTDGPAADLVLFILAFFVAGRFVSRRKLPLAAGAVITALAVMLLGDGRAAGPDDVLPVSAGVLTWIAGVAVGLALDRARSHAAQSERHRLAAQADAERAANAERARAARAVHDLLADALHVMVVQATLAAEAAAADPAAAGVAAEQVRVSGQVALERLGVLMSALATAEQPGPQPGIGDLPDLVAQFRAAGLEVDLAVDGTRELPSAIGLSAYHVVREALINMLKHAPGSGGQVRVQADDRRVDVEVRNGPASGRPGPVPSGYGLVGVRERVLAFGGRMTAGATADGGSLVELAHLVRSPANAARLFTSLQEARQGAVQHHEFDLEDGERSAS